MKKWLAAICAVLLTAVSLTPVLATKDYNLLYDATEQLDSDYSDKLGNELLPKLSNKYSVQIRVDIVDDLEGHTIDEYAQIFYNQYDYGYGDTKDGILLMLYLVPDNTGLALEEYYLLSGGENTDSLYNLALTMDSNMSEWLTADAWSGSIEEDNTAFQSAMQAYMDSTVSFFADGNTLTSGESTVRENQVTADYVTDNAEILSDADKAELEAKAAAISEKYQCGVYIVTVNSYTEYAGEVYQAAKAVYKEYNLGYGANSDGILLLLSMSNRDYGLIAFGYGNTAFTDYGKDKLSEEFLDDFADDDWKAGFTDYLNKSSEMIQSAKEGNPLDVGDNPMVSTVGLLFNVILGAGLSFLVCLFLKETMKSVYEEEEAQAYVTEGGVAIHVRDDQFINSTESRELIRTESKSGSGGGTSVDSDGFSGKSGKF